MVAIKPPTAPPAIAPTFSLDDLVDGGDVGRGVISEGGVEIVANAEDVDTGEEVEAKNFGFQPRT